MEKKNILIPGNTYTWYLWRGVSRVFCFAAVRRSVLLITIRFAAPTAWRTATSASWRSKTAAAGVSLRKNITEYVGSRRKSRRIISIKLDWAGMVIRETERKREKEEEKEEKKEEKKEEGNRDTLVHTFQIEEATISLIRHVSRACSI